MKSLIVLMAVSTALFAAPAEKKTTTKAPASAVAIPKDAVANPDGNSYTWTDKDGKKWVFAKTPFGVMKSALSDTATSNGPSADAGMTKVTDKGDTVRFERQGPFGPITWEKKKTELNDSEKGIMDAQKAKQK